MRNSGRGVVAAVLWLSMLLSGCSSLVKFDLKAEKDLNSYGGSPPLPVVVRVYQLSDDAAFKNASFHDLWKREQATLGPSLLSVKEVIMRPDTEERVEMPLDERTKFVAGVAIFRNPNTSQWRFVDEVSNNMVAQYWHKAFAVSVDVLPTQNRIEIK